MQVDKMGNIANSDETLSDARWVYGIGALLWVGAAGERVEIMEMPQLAFWELAHKILANNGRSLGGVSSLNGPMYHGPDAARTGRRRAGPTPPPVPSLS